MLRVSEHSDSELEIGFAAGSHRTCRGGPERALPAKTLPTPAPGALLWVTKGSPVSFLWSSLGGSLVRDVLCLAYPRALGWTVGTGGSEQRMDWEPATNPTAVFLLQKRVWEQTRWTPPSRDRVTKILTHRELMFMPWWCHQRNAGSNSLTPRRAGGS